MRHLLDVGVKALYCEDIFFLPRTSQVYLSPVCKYLSCPVSLRNGPLSLLVGCDLKLTPFRVTKAFILSTSPGLFSFGLKFGKICATRRPFL